MNFARSSPSPFALPPPPPARKRRVVPPSSEKVAAARLAFVEAKRAAVECDDAQLRLYQSFVIAHLKDWIAAEREERAK